MAKLGYTWYPKDFISDPAVMMMTAAERGVYRDLMDLAYMHDNIIKFNIKQLSVYCNSTGDQILDVLKMKGEKNGDYWTIPSCNKRLNLAKRNRENGKKGGRPKTQIEPKQNPDETQINRQREKKYKVNKYIPTYEDFKQYAFSQNLNTDFTRLKLKYESWVQNKWRDGNDKPIKNWKSKLLNTLPYLKKETTTYNDRL